MVEPRRSTMRKKMKMRRRRDKRGEGTHPANVMSKSEFVIEFVEYYVYQYNFIEREYN